MVYMRYNGFMETQFPSNAPQGYICPICAGLKQPGGPDTMIEEGDVVYRDDRVAAIINTFFWGKNPGHVIVVPVQHHESLYLLPQDIGHRIFDIVQLVARAMKTAYGCTGITTRQNNEPDGDQHAFHYHHHVVPRYPGDDYNRLKPKYVWTPDPAVRAGYAEKLKKAFESA
jgi:histidine triad (HIT) family protein